MRALKPTIATVSLVAAALLATGCGGDEQPAPSIPLDSATPLVAKLQEVQDNVDNGSCVVAQTKVSELQDQLSQLPSTTNKDVVEALQRGTLNLAGLIDQDCEHDTTTTDTDTDTTPSETTETTESTESTQSTQTTTPTQTTPPTTTTTPPNNGGGGVGPPGGGL